MKPERHVHENVSNTQIVSKEDCGTLTEPDSTNGMRTPHKLMASIFDIYSGNLFKQPTNYFKTCTVWLDLQDTDIINLPCREEDKAKLKSYVISLCRIWVTIEVSQSMKLFFDNSSNLLQLHSLSQKDKSA